MSDTALTSVNATDSTRAGRRLRYHEARIAAQPTYKRKVSALLDLLRSEIEVDVSGRAFNDALALARELNGRWPR